jgi:hypothetical protein
MEAIKIEYPAEFSKEPIHSSNPEMSTLLRLEAAKTKLAFKAGAVVALRAMNSRATSHEMLGIIAELFMEVGELQD